MMWGVRVGVVLIVVSAAILCLLNVLDILRFDVASDPVEATVLLAQTELLKGQPLYDPERWVSPPYRINTYGPVFYYVVAAVQHLWGEASSLGAGRAVSLVALLAALTCLWILARRLLELPSYAAALAVLIPLAFPPMLMNAGLNRVDMLGVACSLLGFVVGMRSRWGLAVAPLLFNLAVFTKPTAIAGVVGLSLLLIQQRRYRALSALMAGTLLVGGLCLVLLLAAYHGAFLQSVFLFNRHPLHVQGGLNRVLATSQTLALPVAAAVAITMLSKGQCAERTLGGYFLAALGISVFTSLNVGANLNLFLEPGLLMGPVLASGWMRWSRHSTSTWIGLQISLLLLCSSYLLLRRGLPERRAAARSYEWIQRASATSPVLSSLAMPVKKAGACLVVNELYIFSRLAETGRVDQALLVKQLANERIPLVISEVDLASPEAAVDWTPEIRFEVLAHYRIEEERDGVRVYRPLGRSRIEAARD